MKSLLQSSNEHQMKQLLDLDENVLAEISGGHPHAEPRVCIEICPDGTWHITAEI